MKAISITATLLVMGFISYSQSAVHYLNLAREHAALENLDRAEAYVLQGIEEYPKDYDLNLYLIRIKAWKGEYENMEILLTELLEWYPHQVELHELLLKRYAWAEDWKALAEQAKKTMMLYYENPSFHAHYALALIKLGMDAEAHQVLAEAPEGEEIEELKKDQRQYHYSFGGVRYQNETFSSARQTTHLASLVVGSKKDFNWRADVVHGSLFGKQATQLKGEVFPKISEQLFTIVGASVSNSVVFPRVTGSLGIDYTLNKWQVGAGFKYFNFLDEEVWMYQAVTGVYAGPVYVFLQFYYTGDAGQSTYLGNFRWYIQNDYTFIQLQAGMGGLYNTVPTLADLRQSSSSLALTYHLQIDRWIGELRGRYQKDIQSEQADINRVLMDLTLLRKF